MVAMGNKKVKDLKTQRFVLSDIPVTTIVTNIYNKNNAELIRGIVIDQGVSLENSQKILKKKLAT